jgi:hypothetical protein
MDKIVRNAALVRRYAAKVAGCLSGESARYFLGTQLKEHTPSHLYSSARWRRERAFGGDIRVDNALVAAVTLEALCFAQFPMDLGLAAGRHNEIRPAASTVRLASRLSVLVPGES